MSAQTPPTAVQETGTPVPVAPLPAPTLVQVPENELADLRRRADRYRFLFKTIVTVTGILAATVLAIVLFALGIDM